MSKPELEFHKPTAEWRPAFPGIEGFWEQILSHDPDTGDYTRLMRVEPGADSAAAGRLTHVFWEEVYIVEGDLTDTHLNETFTAGMYACRPPGMLHGPFRSTGGCLMLEITVWSPTKMSAAYLVIYEGQPENREAFLHYYIEEHLPIIWTWPKVRQVEVAMGEEGGDALANPSGVFMIARFLFDNLEDLRAALQSPQRLHAREDSANFPPFQGNVYHQAVSIIDVPRQTS